MIHLGTSGWSFRDWVGVFYPPGIPAGQMLNYYAARFSAVEVNSTYYRIPHPRVMAEIERKTPDGFRFTVKLNSEMTHGRTRDRNLFEEYRRALEPLEAAGKFHGALAQFPWAFQENEPNRDHLRFLRDALGDRPLFVEFRHDSWNREEVFAFLEELKVGFCCVDEPSIQGLFPPIVRAVGEVGYVRLHGRNARDWWGRGPNRYHYLYTESELHEWAGKIRELEGRTREVFVFFNNCHEGGAAQNARRMGDLLGL